MKAEGICAAPRTEELQLDQLQQQQQQQRQQQQQQHNAARWVCLVWCGWLAGRKKEKYSAKSDEYEVEDIVGYKKEKGLDYFRVRWKGFDESDDTWEVESNLAHAPMFHSKMQELRKEAEQKALEREAEAAAAAAAAHAKKRKRQGPVESDPSRPCDEAPAESDECEFRIYATGTKVPKNHLPDELALGSRLSILRFKRSPQSSADPQQQQQELEEGHDITVTYTIDGTDTYTIPFSAARRYCCQRLLSYLIRRTTFRTPRGGQDAAAAAAAAADAAGAEGGSSSSSGHPVTTCAADDGSVEECAADRADHLVEKSEVYVQTDEVKSSKPAAAAAAAAGALREDPQYASISNGNSSSSNGSRTNSTSNDGGIRNKNVKKDDAAAAAAAAAAVAAAGEAAAAARSCTSPSPAPAVVDVA
ncbi:hypothetical protein, conserved [Eimeria tenella]|uniref:Chromo domain-containing protein n=1 Tax=Eimeria tenella TaxID=5802 RepID=U6L2H5_EIMTE|nr:hypothetical protein, conserved [Eimeria tenella]CDJ41950.1 hypothetical protein, conserved [Eimeria tenella]|eukprot:XP_013232700.1 hypothetical protein, conserved [Eimeria tenella]